MTNRITEQTFEKAGKELEKLLFPVELGEVFVKTPFYPEGFQSSYFNAVVAHLPNQLPKIFSVVTDNYRLVSNEEAIYIGKEIYRELFNQVNPSEIKPFKVIYPNTLSYCHIQLVHQKVNFEVWEQETWMPFIQVTNSYNRTFALTFELGFVRSLNSSGVIFRKKTANLKSSHNKTNVLKWMLNISSKELNTLQMEFVAYMKNLKRFYVDPTYIMPLVCKAFGFHFKEDKRLFVEIHSENENLDQLEELRTVVDRLANHYFAELGHNAYAAFNVLADLISNESDRVSKFNNFSLHSSSYYYKPTEWLYDFMDRIQRTDFNMEEYLREYLKYGG
ncbi:MAG: hypothetical protein K9G61_03980 [Bacteroidales bacterium]|nr:hypothetical protein [Bacteroidales bacterium]